MPCQYLFSLEVIKSLRKKGFKIIFITSRENKYWQGKAKFYLKKWLKKHDIQFDEIYGNISNKSEFCVENNIDYLIEDNFEYVKSANKKGIKSILIKTTYNQNYKHKLNTFAENWLDVYSILANEFNFDKNDIISFNK